MAKAPVASPAKSFTQTARLQRPLFVFFLDLDDVLITRRAEHALGAGKAHANTIDPVAMALFNRLAQKAEEEKGYDVRVVLTSARRFDRGIRQFLQRNGLKARFHRNWRTGRGGPLRGDEVQSWLKAHPKASGYLIFDDREDFLPEQEKHLVHCQLDNGLSWQNYDYARRFMGLKP